MRGRFVAIAVVLAGVAVWVAPTQAASIPGSTVGKVSESAVIAVGKRSKKRRRRASSRGVGGYSYSYADSLLSFDNTRILRDRDDYFDRQAGPFDHGFFFDSGSQPRGGESPYLN